MAAGFLATGCGAAGASARPVAPVSASLFAPPPFVGINTQTPDDRDGDGVRVADCASDSVPEDRDRR